MRKLDDVNDHYADDTGPPGCVIGVILGGVMWTLFGLLYWWRR